MSKYVVAGGSTFSFGLKKLIELGYWHIDGINKFLNEVTDLYLTSIGEMLSKKGKFDKDTFVSKVVKAYDKVYHNEWFGNAKKVVDSGGYQISINYVKVDEIPDFIDAYIDLLNHPKVGQSCEYMLSLDIVGDKPTFSSVEELDYLNRLSLEKTIQYDTSKVFFVYHFINPRLEKFWWKLIEDYHSYFKHYSIGGLVAFSRGSNFPFNVYVLPLLKIINLKRSYNDYDPFKFHILGVSSFTDIFSFIVFEKYLKEIYDLDIQINFDSTRAIRETSLAKRLQIFYENHLVPISIKSSNLNQRIFNELTNADLAKYALQELIDKFDINIELPEKLTANVIYKDDGKGSIYREYEVLFILASTYALQKTVNLYEDEANAIVKAMLDGDEIKAQNLILEAIEVTNYGRRTKNALHKARSIFNSLKIIKDRPSMQILNNLMERTMEGVQPFKVFDGQVYSKDLEDVF
jgi:hypothetical protein